MPTNSLPNQTREEAYKRVLAARMGCLTGPPSIPYLEELVEWTGKWHEAAQEALALAQASSRPYPNIVEIPDVPRADGGKRRYSHGYEATVELETVDGPLRAFVKVSAFNRAQAARRIKDHFAPIPVTICDMNMVA